MIQSIFKMAKNNEILIPFSIDDPLVGRVIYPLDKVLWIGFICALLSFLYYQLVRILELFFTASARQINGDHRDYNKKNEK